MRKGNGLPLNGHDYGILFCGTDGSLLLDRSRVTRSPPTRSCSPTASSSPRGTARSARSTSSPRRSSGSDGQTPHIDNFLECLASREKPICDIEVGHHSTNTCHLGNIAYKLGRKLDWDEATETFKDDREANALLTREPRRGFELPEGLRRRRVPSHLVGRPLARPAATVPIRQARGRIMKPITGLILRRVGLLIEFACLLAFVTLPDDREVFAGVDLRRVLIAGVALGFVLWIVGMAAIWSSARRARG